MSKHKVEIDVSLKMDGLSKDFDDLERKAKSGTKSTVSAVSQLVSVMEDAGKSAKGTGQDFEKAADTMEKSSKEAAGDVGGLKQSVDETQNSTERLKDSEQELGKQSRETGKDQEELGDKTEETRQKVEHSRKSFLSWHDVAETAVKSVATAAGILFTSMGAVAGISTKFGTEYKQASNTIQASTGATKEEMEGLREVMKNVYAGNFGEDMNEVAEAVSVVKKSLGGTEKQIQQVTEAAFGFRDTFGYDIPESTRAASMLMKTFGTDALHAYDLMAKGAQKGLDFSEEMLDSITEYAPQFAKAGLSAEQMFNIMASGYEAGAWNLDKVGDAVKELNIRLVDGSKTTAEGLEVIGLNADEVAKKMSEGGDVATETYKQVVKGLAEMDDKQAQNIAGVNLFGTMWEDLGPGVVEQLAVMEGAYDDVKGTMEEINKVKYDDAGSALEALKRKAEVSLLLPISENIMPAISGATEAAIGYIDKLANAYESEGVNGLVEKAGEVFGNIAVNAAEQAPEMVEVAVSFVDNTVQGIKKNRKKLADAGIELTKTLCSAAVKLLPKELQEPVEDAMDDLVDSITGGGIRNGVKTFSNILKNGFEVVTKITKTVLPPFIKIVDKAADNLDVIAVAATSVFTAFKGYKVVTETNSVLNKGAKAWKVASDAVDVFNAAQLVAMESGTKSNATLTIGQTAVGLLTGKINLAAAAQSAWNAIMSANPIGIVIAGITAVTAGIAAYCLVADRGKTSQEMLNESLGKAGENFRTVGNAAAKFTEGIKNAGSIFDGFNDSIIVSNEVQQECASQMDAIQGEITQIARTATEERRNLTEIEIQRLDELFSKMRELTAQELAIQKAYASAVRDSAKSLADTYDGNAKEYAEASQTIINSAYKTKDSVVGKAYEQMLETNAINQQLVGTAEQYTQEWYENEAAAAQERYQQAIESATKECGDTLSIIQQGYADRATAGMEYLTKIGEVNIQAEQEKQRHEDRLKELGEEYAKHEDETRTLREAAEATYHANVAKENQEHEATMAGIWDNITANMSSEQMEQAGIWLSMITQTALSGGELSEEAKNTAGNFIEALSQMPEDTREKFENTVEGALKGLEGFNEIQKKAEDEGKSFLEILAEVLEVHSPSRAVKKIFSNVWPGAVEGLEEGEEDVPRKGKSVISNFFTELGGDKVKQNAKKIGNNVLKSFNIGVESKKGETDKISKEIAESSNELLGSEDTKKTGKQKGDEYNKGVASNKSPIDKTSKNIADSSNKLLGSADTKGTGSRKSKEYDLGVGSNKSSIDLTSKTLATSSDTLLGSMNTRATGANKSSEYNSGLGSNRGAIDSTSRGLSNTANSGMGTANTRSTGRGLGSEYAVGIGEKASLARREGQGLASNAEGRYGMRSVSAYSAGHDFGSGFGGGVRSAIQLAVNAAASLASRALSTINRVLDINSPSRKTRKTGHSFDKGLILGIKDKTKDAVKVAGSLARSAAEAMRIPDFVFGIDDAEVQNAMRIMDAAVARQRSHLGRAAFVLGTEEHEKRSNGRLSKKEIQDIGKAIANVVNDHMEDLKIVYHDRELGRVIREVGR